MKETLVGLFVIAIVIIVIASFVDALIFGNPTQTPWLPQHHMPQQSHWGSAVRQQLVVELLQRTETNRVIFMCTECARSWAAISCYTVFLASASGRGNIVYYP